MKNLSLGAYLYLGTSLRYLQDATPGMEVHGWGRVLPNLENFAREIKGLNLRVTSRVFEQKQLSDLITELKNSNADAVLTLEQAAMLGKLMGNLRETIIAEANSLPVYMVTEKRLDVERLVNNPDTFLHQDTFAKLPPIAQHDMLEASKCIAFDTATAAAFLLLRATESALRAYYHKHFRVKKDAKLMWGPMIIRLQGKTRKPRPSKILLDHLDNIRFNFRNPTDHPEKTYGIDEVQDLFHLVADVLNRVAAELP